MKLEKLYEEVNQNVKAKMKRKSLDWKEFNDDIKANNAEKNRSRKYANDVVKRMRSKTSKENSNTAQELLNRKLEKAS